MADNPTSTLATVIARVLRDASPDTGRSDGELLTAFVDRRSSSAFAELVRRHGPMVLGVCLRILRHAHDAEDAFQASFLVLARKAASVSPRSAVGNWLYGVAQQTALRSRAAIMRRRTREMPAASVPEPAVVDVHSDDLAAVLDMEVGRLPSHYRTALVLCDIEGRTRKDAAETLGCPEGSISSRLSRAREMLARRLTRRGVALSITALAALLARTSTAAPVSPALIESTVDVGTVVAAGMTSTASVSSAVASLANETIKAMFLAKLKTTVLTVLLIGVISGAALVGFERLTESRTPPMQVVAAADEPTPEQTPAGKGNQARPPMIHEDPTTPKTSWGPAVDGLQAGLRITEGHGQRLNPGEQVQFDVVVRNLTDRDISFTDHPGKRLYLNEPKGVLAEFGWMAVYNGPGPIDFPTLVGAGRELRVGSAGIYNRAEKQTNTWDSLLPGKYRVSAADVLMHAKGVDKNPDLTTGAIDIEILKQPAKSDGAKADTPAWGEPKNGVRLGIAPGTPGRIAVALENVGKDDVMINVGMMLANGKRQLPTGIRLTAIDAENKSHDLTFNLPGVAGRVDQFLVPLPAGSRYTLSIALSEYALDRFERPEPGLYKLKAELVGGPIDRPNADMAGLTTFPLWTGPATSGETPFVVVEEKK